MQRRNDPAAGEDRAPTVAQLRAFLTVAQTEHVTRAADELGLSQPAVSHQLRALERSLGLPLVERVGRRIRLSADARALVPSAAAAYSGLLAMIGVAEARRGLDQGTLVVAASNTVGVYHLSGWLAGFVRDHSHLEITIRMVNTAGATEMLRLAEADCALVEGPCATDGLEELVVGHDELVVVAGSNHPLAASVPVRPSQLAGHRYLAREDGSGTEMLAASLLGSHYGSGPVLELHHIEAVRAGVLAGLGYAVLPTVAVAEDLRAGRATNLLGDRLGLVRELRALRRSGAHGPALEAFWRHLTDIAGARGAGVGAG